jgi:hypothetical protein
MSRRKHISISRLMDFMRCPAAYFDSVINARAKADQKSEGEVLGDVTHKLTAGEDVAVVREFIDEKLPEMAVERRAEVLEIGAERAERAKAMSAPEVTHERREVQLEWFDAGSGYTIYAKPDELFHFDEERNGRTISVMQITDVKAEADEVKGYHWRQVYLFGLIATMALHYRHAIKLVVRLAKHGTEEVKWFSSQETWRQLAKVRATLKEIDTAWETRVFEHRPGGYCKDCPLLATCKGGQMELGRRQALAEQMTSIKQFPLPVLNGNQACA